MFRDLRIVPIKIFFILNIFFKFLGQMLSATQELITPDKWLAFNSLKYMTKANEKQHINLWHLLMS